MDGLSRSNLDLGTRGLRDEQDSPGDGEEEEEKGRHQAEDDDQPVTEWDIYNSDSDNQQLCTDSVDTEHEHFGTDSFESNKVDDRELGGREK